MTENILKPSKFIVGNWPRRIRLDLATPAEKAIRDAMAVVESAGASVELTNAIVALKNALEFVADHIDRELQK